MLRAKLLAATAVVTLMAAPAFAQEVTPPTAPTPAQNPAQAPTPQTDASMPVMPEATAPAAEAAAPAAATVAQAATPAAGETVVDVLKASGQFTTLLAALDAAQLTDTLATRPAISIFAPTDAAFAALPEADRTRLMDPANAAELRQLLLYHVIVADVTPDQIQGKKGGVPTAAESQILLDGTGLAIKADAATVSAELDASNGGVFPIDKVLNPANSMAAMGDEDAAPTEAAAPAASAAPATAPSGEPAATTTTTTSPPVANPTDNPVDPSATPPVDAADPAADGGDEANPTPQ